jgi:hypothetical protein
MNLAELREPHSISGQSQKEIKRIHARTISLGLRFLTDLQRCAGAAVAKKRPVRMVLNWMETGEVSSIIYIQGSAVALRRAAKRL